MRVSVFVLLVVVLALFATSAVPAHASAGSCVTDPSSAVTGEVIAVACEGLAPNTIANTYLVEPDGRSISGCESIPVFTYPCNPKADSAGIVRFVVVTGFSELAFGALGEWQVVADNPKGASSAGRFTLRGSGQGVSGATLTVTQLNGRTFAFRGTGFAPNEYVSAWADHPSGCSGTSGSVHLILAVVS